eukprot:394962-Rhodomonas_salina.1
MSAASMAGDIGVATADILGILVQVRRAKTQKTGRKKGGGFCFGHVLSAVVPLPSTRVVWP